MRDAADSRSPERPEMITLDAWAARDEDEGGELVDGTLVEEEVPSYLHEWIVTWLLVTLGSWILPRGGGIVPSEIKLAVRPDRGRKADLVVHLPGVRLPSRHSALLREPPSIVIEVISPQPRDARRDRVDKLDEYATFRVPWYWVVDPGLRTLEVYELCADGRYVRALGASQGVVTIPGCDAAPWMASSGSTPYQLRFAGSHNLAMLSGADAGATAGAWSPSPGRAGESARTAWPSAG